MLAAWSEWQVDSCNSQIARLNGAVGNDTRVYDFSDCQLNESENQVYINWYVTFGMLSVLFVTTQGIIMAVLRVRASKTLHAKMAAHALRMELILPVNALLDGKGTTVLIVSLLRQTIFHI